MYSSLDFHTIQSILKPSKSLVTSASLTYFHTIQSILKQTTPRPWVEKKIEFPYYSVYFKARQLGMLVDSAGEFPYYSVYFKARYRKTVDDVLKWHFHTIQSILKPPEPQKHQRKPILISILFSLF